MAVSRLSLWQHQQNIAPIQQHIFLQGSGGCFYLFVWALRCLGQSPPCSICSTAPCWLNCSVCCTHPPRSSRTADAGFYSAAVGLPIGPGSLGWLAVEGCGWGCKWNPDRSCGSRKFGNAPCISSRPSRTSDPMRSRLSGNTRRREIDRDPCTEATSPSPSFCQAADQHLMLDSSFDRGSGSVQLEHIFLC